MFKENKAIAKKKYSKLLKFHFSLSIIFFVLYVVLSLIYSPEFLFFDVKSKFRALANEILVVTAKVIGPPQKPVVSATAVCKEGTLFVDLDWADDENTETFDIERDALPLITGLDNSHYMDFNVVVGTSYTYTVTAHGPMAPGIAVSDPVVVNTPASCEISKPEPLLNITSFDGKSLLSYSGTPATFSRRPVFSGITNVPSAEITFYVSGSTIVIGRTLANINGYWRWKPPTDFDYGQNLIVATAVDPEDPSRTASDSLRFKILREKEKKEEEKKQEEQTTTTPKSVASPPTAPPAVEKHEERPIDFRLTLEENSVFQGKELHSIIEITSLDPRFEKTEAIVRYVIYDEKGEKKMSLMQEIILEKGSVIRKKIIIPPHYKDGKYRLQAEIIFNCYNISDEKFFEVLRLPLINLGGGIIITYPEFLSHLGLIASLLFFILLLWLLLFYREHRLQLRALRHITEQQLEKLGFWQIKRRKEVSR